MEFRSLADTSVPRILDTFNSSFSDYSIPFKLNEDQLRSKISSDNIDLNYSVGAFEEKKLVGFILHGFRRLEGKGYLYNGGTGVIPNKRGRGVAAKMYEYILPTLHQNNIKSVQLEVISDNHPAINIYKKVGFQLVRKLNCYKGYLHINHINDAVVINAARPSDWGQLTSFWDFEPTWQNSIKSIEGMQDQIVIFSASLINETVGYLALNTTNNRIIQLGVSKSHRRKHIGSALIQYVANDFNPEISTINIDAHQEATNSFFLNCGLKKYLQQDEMLLNLKL